MDWILQVPWSVATIGAGVVFLPRFPGLVADVLDGTNAASDLASMVHGGAKGTTVQPTRGRITLPQAVIFTTYPSFYHPKDSTGATVGGNQPLVMLYGRNEKKPRRGGLEPRAPSAMEWILQAPDRMATTLRCCHPATEGLTPLRIRGGGLPPGAQRAAGTPR